MQIYNHTAYNPNMIVRHRAQVLNDRILHSIYYKLYKLQQFKQK